MTFPRRSSRKGGAGVEANRICSSSVRPSSARMKSMAARISG